MHDLISNNEISNRADSRVHSPRGEIDAMLIRKRCSEGGAFTMVPPRVTRKHVLCHLPVAAAILPLSTVSHCTGKNR